jgi:sterol O-acyltransferase
MPRSLGEALRAVGMTLDTPGSETPSEEDYEENVRPTLTGPSSVRNRYRYARRGRPLLETLSASTSTAEPESRFRRRDSGVYIVSDEDNSLQQLLMTSLQWPEESSGPKTRRRKFADLVFTRQFSAFDRHNPSASNSPFHGFYTLFWLAVSLFVLKISVRNWQVYGNPLGTSDIMKTMFHRDGMTSLLSDTFALRLTGLKLLFCYSQTA